MKHRSLLVIVAHPKLGRIGRFSLSEQRLRWMCVAVAVLAVLGLGMTAEWWKATAENARLEAENRALQEITQSQAVTIDERDQQVESLSELAYEVSIAYGIRRGGRGAQSALSLDVPTLYYESRSQFGLIQSAITESRGGALGALANTTPSIWPVRGRITSSFGQRSDPFKGNVTFHPGLDISAPYGTPVRATADGYVQSTGWEAGLGRTVIISHGRSEFQTVYGHLKESLVRVGQKVRRGEVIGLVGATGRTTGKHLHYQVSYKGLAVNPMKYLRAQQPGYAANLSD